MLRKILYTLSAVALVPGALSHGNEVLVTSPGVWPLMKRASINPAVKLTVKATETWKKGKLTITLDEPGQVEHITLRSGADKGMNFKETEEYGTAMAGKGKTVVIKMSRDLPAGEHHLWLDVKPSEKAIIGSTVTVEKVKFSFGSKNLEPEMQPVTQRIGIMLGFPGDKVGQQTGASRDCAAFRIPGLIQTKKGTLLGVFDARYDNEVDLCRDIDVAVVRSTDGGQTWTLPEVNMDSGPGMANGCGDPCILQDKKGRIWMQALACHFAPGARAINASGTGTDPSRTGQWEMASDLLL